jgi:glucose-1-phosphate thymidylyltransferase
MTVRAVILARGELAHMPWPLAPLRRELAPVANRALIDHQLEGLHAAGVREVAVVGDDALGASARTALAESGIGLDLFHVRAEGGAAAELLAAKEFLGAGPFVAELASSLTRHDLRRSVELAARKRLGALAVLSNERSRAAQVVPLRRGDVPAGAAVAPEMLAGASSFVLGGEIFDAARAAIEARGGDAGIADAIEELTEREGRVKAVAATGWSKRLDGIEDLLELNRLVLSELPVSAKPEPLPGNRVMGPVSVDRAATVESSVLNGPLAIAGGARIADSYIGPYTAIGADATVDGAEVERSLLLSGAAIDTPGVRIEGSVLGTRARIGRDLGPPRALRVWVGHDARLSLA